MGASCARQPPGPPPRTNGAAEEQNASEYLAAWTQGGGSGSLSSKHQKVGVTHSPIAHVREQWHADISSGGVRSTHGVCLADGGLRV